MRKLILFLALLGLSISTQAQVWTQMGNVLQRQTNGTYSNYRFNLGSPGFMYFYNKTQTDSLFNIAIGSGVTSFNTRTGVVSLLSADVTTALGFTPVPNTRQLINGYGVLGGGTLATDRTLAVDTTSANGVVSKPNLASQMALKATASGETLQAVATRGNSFNGTIITNNTTAGNKVFYRGIYFGTSITRGFLTSFGDSTFVNRSAKGFGIFQDNRGTDGSQVSSLFNSVAVPYNSAALKYVFLQYETNEFNFQTDTTVFKVAYAAAIDSLTSLRGIPRYKMIMIGAPYVTITRTIPISVYIAIAKKIALAKGIKYVEMYNYMLTHGGSSLLNGDGLHPNNRGQAAIADNLVATFSALVTDTKNGLHADSIVTATNINANILYSRSISSDTLRSQYNRASIQLDSLSIDPSSITKRKSLTLYEGSGNWSGIGKVINSGVGIFSQSLTNGFSGWWHGQTPQTATSANATFFIDGNRRLNINLINGPISWLSQNSANTYVNLYDNGAGGETGIGLINTANAGLAIYANSGNAYIYAGNGITRTTASTTTAAWYISPSNKFTIVPGNIAGPIDYGSANSSNTALRLYNNGTAAGQAVVGLVNSGAGLVVSANGGGNGTLYLGVGINETTASIASASAYVGTDGFFHVSANKMRGEIGYGTSNITGNYFGLYNNNTSSGYTGLGLNSTGAKLIVSANGGGGGEVFFTVGHNATDATEANSAGYISNANKFFFNSGVGYNGATSGTATVIAPAVAGTTTITLPSVTSTLATTADLTLKENIANKQNSLAVDGTGVKYPTVDAVNAGLAFKSDKANFINIADLGATGDSTVNVTTIVNNAVKNYKEVYFPKGVYLVTNLVNITGSKITGPGIIVKQNTYAFQKLNISTDINQRFFGQEYLGVFLKALYNQQSVYNTQPTCTIIYSGDSTTQGNAAIGFIDQLVDQTATQFGINGVVSYNKGHSGMSQFTWQSTYLAQDLAQFDGLSTPGKLYIIGWGINDPTGGRTANQVLFTLDSCLNYIRNVTANHGVDKLAILIRSPSATTEDVDGHKAQRYYEDIAAGQRILARKYKCGFIDINGLLEDAYGMAINMTTDYPAGDTSSHTHPLAPRNAIIASAISDFIYPSYYRKNSAISTDTTKLNSALPSTYPMGTSIKIVYAVNGFPIDGILTTHRSASVDATEQTLTNFNNLVSTTTTKYYRGGWSGGAWKNWSKVEKYDQSLNTTDDVTFKKLSSTDRLSTNTTLPGAFGGNIANLSSTGHGLYIQGGGSSTDALQIYNYNTSQPLFSVKGNGAVYVPGLIASQAVFTDASKNLVSNTVTGSGNVVMSASPTLTGTPLTPNLGPATVSQQIVNATYVEQAFTSYGANIINITANRTITASDFLAGHNTQIVVFADCTSGAITITIPAPSASGWAGPSIFVKKIDASANAVTVTPASGSVADGNTLTTQFQARQLISNATSWYNF